MTTPSLTRRDCLRGLIGASAAAQVGDFAFAQQPPSNTLRDPALAERAQKLMREAIVIDAYNCGAYSKHPHEPTGWFNRRGPTQVDLIKAIEGRVTAAGFDVADGMRAPIALVGGRRRPECAKMMVRSSGHNSPMP